MWAGVIPIVTEAREPEPDPRLAAGIPRAGLGDGLPAAGQAVTA